MSENVIDRVRAHFSDQEDRIIEVPEWGEGGKPLYIRSRPMSLNDKNSILKGTKNNQMAILVNAIILMARKDDGEKMFTLADKQFLMTEADSEVVARVANEILAVPTDEEAEKN